MRFSLGSIRQYLGNLKVLSVRQFFRRGLRHLRETGDRLTGGGLRSLAKRQLRRLRDAGDRLTGGGLRALRKRVLAASLRPAMSQPVLKAIGSRVLEPFPRLAQCLYRLATALDTVPTTSGIANAVSPSSAQVKDCSLLVQSLYKAAFGRLADPEGLATRVQQLQRGVSLEALAEEMVASAEFQARHWLSQEVDTGYLTALYRDGLERQPDAEGLAHWLGEGEKGATRAKVLAAFCGSDEAIAKVASLFVSSLYYTAFGRNPDEGGLTNCVKQLQSGSSLAVLVEGVVASAEFQTRYGSRQKIDAEFLTALYRVGRRRDPDPEGLAHWLREGDNGATRAKVLAAFAGSTEALQEVVGSANLARRSPLINDTGRAIGQSLRVSTKQSNRRVVYTCLFGHSEPFLDLKIDRDEMTDFVCFTDDVNLRSDFWTIVQAPKSLLDPHRRSKGFKHRPHLLFPDHEQSLYVDNIVKLVKPPDAFFKLLDQSDAPLWMFVHPDRHCIYDEAEAVKEAHLDDPALVDMQMTHYRNLGYPRNNGLNATGVMVRRHHDQNLITAMNDWHDQVLRFSKRDQLSFNVIRHFHQLAIKEFDGRLAENELIEWPVIPEGKRLPRDFDDAEYLFLHADVAAAGVNPRKHYLDYGIIEGRLYRISQAATPKETGRPQPVVAELQPFEGDNYWSERYRSGGNSGGGSYGRLAEFKASIINAFVQEHGINSVIEFGCGDGAQLQLARYPAYLGFDIADEAVAMCRAIAANDKTKAFRNVSQYKHERADLALSLDVIFHLVEDHVFQEYMRCLFSSADRYVIIYSSNYDEDWPAPHVKHRKFTDWIEKFHSDFVLIQDIPNRYPNESFADFYIFEKFPSRKHCLPGHLVLSVTSYEKRFPTLELALRRILHQSMLPDETVLWISPQDSQHLPHGVIELQRIGLSIQITKDLGSYKKILPALKRYPDSFIITLDDDLIYPRDVIEPLVANYRSPTEILCRRAHEVQFDSNGRILPYLQWRLEIQDKHDGPNLFPTSGAGVLYPPKVLAPQVLDEIQLQRLAPSSDDIWLFWMGRLAGRKVRLVGRPRRLAMWPGSDEVQLAYGNTTGGGNDRAIAAMMAHYGSPFDHPIATSGDAAMALG
jgi:hypothetical protein